MSATLYGDTDLIFGVPVVAGIVMQASNARLMGKYTDATDEDDDSIGFATHHTNMGEMDGTYLFKGDDVVSAIGDALPAELTEFDFTDVAVYEIGRKRVKNNYAEGDYKAVGAKYS
jgi:hypothetical protein